MTIPRKLHFVWLGGKIIDLHRLLVERWRALHPGWQVTVWDEPSVLDLIGQMGTRLEARFMQQGLSLSTRSDLARYHIVAREGGIYLDTDFVGFRPLDPLLRYIAFGVFEEFNRVCAGVFGSVPGHPMFETVFETLRGRDYTLDPVSLAGPLMFGPICQQALQNGSDTAILDASSFLPVTYKEKDYLEIWLTKDLTWSYGAHLWAESWCGNPAAQSSLLLRTVALFANPTTLTK